MKKRRAWSTLDEDADEQESAALAASLAAAKDTTARSDALISSAKEDLNDHQRWLRAQSAAVDRDRHRHERWLQRQQDLRVATAKKDRVRRHRLLVRHRALQAIRQAFVDLSIFVGSWIAFGAGKIAAGVRFAARSIALSAALVWHSLVRAVSSLYQGLAYGLTTTARALGQAFGAAGRGLGQGAGWTAAKMGSAARGAGAGVAAGAAWSGSKASASVRAGSKALSASSHVVAAEAGKLSRRTGHAMGNAGHAMGKAGHAVGKAGHAIGSGLASTGDSAATIAAATRDGVATRAATTASRAAKIGAMGGRELARASTWTASRVAAIPSKLFIHLARFGHEVQHFARVRAATARTSAPSIDRDGSPSAPSAFKDGRAAQHATGAALDAGHSASVHVFETYGPYPEGTTLFGQPANDPWPADEPLLEGGDADRRDAMDASGGHGRMAALAIPDGLGSDVAARMTSVLSSVGRRVNERAGGLGQAVRTSTVAGSAWLRSQAARARASAQTGMAAVARAQEHALAQGAGWTQKKGLDHSQMMIIAGAVLLVLGGLLVGGGFLMRSTSDPVIAAGPATETFSKITWSFDQPELPLPERAIFTLSGTPEAFLINGVSITGVNNSDEPLTDLEAALSPDVKRPDLLLDVAVEAQDSEAGTPNPVATVPPGAAFRLVFSFPPEARGSADGISVDDFFESYGGLLLKLRYDSDDAERSVIQYLDPEMLKAQLDEVAAEAGGS